MNSKDVKEMVSQTYPLQMTYKRGKRLQVKHGRHRRSYSKSVGVSSDNVFSVELIGKSKNLAWIEFMFGMHDPSKAASAAIAIEKVIKNAHPNWDDTDEEWLRDQIGQRKNGGRGKISTRFVLLPAIPPVPVMFVKVKA